jgi:hypothetical protein
VEKYPVIERMEEGSKENAFLSHLTPGWNQVEFDVIGLGVGIF